MAKKKIARRPGDSKHHKSTNPKTASQSYARTAIASLGATGRPPVTPWKPGSAGTAPDGSRFVHYGRYIRAGGERHWRTSNPGNIKIGAFARANGAIGRDGQYAIFPDDFTGACALLALLKTPAYDEKLVREVLCAHVTNLDGVNEAKARAQRFGLDPSMKLRSLREENLALLVGAITSTALAGQPRTHSVGKSSNPAWAAGIFNESDPGTTVARTGGPLYFMYPAGWNANTWYMRQSDGTYTVSPDQNPKDLMGAPGQYIKYDGNNKWEIMGVGAPGSDAGAPLPEDGPDAGSASPPGEVPPLAIITVQLTRSDGSTYTVTIVPPGQEVTDVPPNAIVVADPGGGYLVLSNNDGSQWSSNPGSGGEAPPDNPPPPDPQPDNGGTTTQEGSP